ncbi:MAG TPA: selenocysteine-specific translation elongation factor [Gemmatimonadales bacterium]|nr:selenocysteine-specific translation elongation factor [Gemmatimonadales bacterium]
MAAGRRFVIGTAGHIDHGKTALVKALTGVDTDRWEEEKRRGITIDLGFAPLPLGPDLTASVVDVPGHEGFVRNMLAGATGIDVALLVVAADDGIMPQTEEHLAIVELLGIRRGIPVLTKTDLVDADWLELVRAEVIQRLSRSPIQWEAPVATSATTGAGLEELKVALRSAAAGLVDRPTADLFRLPIDRVFALAGAGTVVTGSTWSGTVRVGDMVQLLPVGREARVRSIEVHGQATEAAGPGRRTALALVGVDRSDLGRGQVAVTGPGWAATMVLDAGIELLADSARPLTARARVRVHLGTAEVLARVAQTGPIKAGERGRVRLVLEGPLVARGGDRFVLRSFSPVTTIGGGTVLDPYPNPTVRLTERRLSVGQDLSERFLAWTAEAGLSGLAEDQLAVRLGAPPLDVTQVIAAAGKGVIGSAGWWVSRGALASQVEHLVEVLEAYHRDRPLDPGMSLEALRAAVPESPPQAILDLLLDLGRRKQAFEIEGGSARRPGWQPVIAAGPDGALAVLSRRLREARWQIPTVAELERELSDVPIRPLLAHLVRVGGVEQIDQERYASSQALAEFRETLVTMLSEAGASGRATPAELRVRFGLTRKYLIPLLEWADRRGITRRDGDARVLVRLTRRDGDLGSSVSSA